MRRSGIAVRIFQIVRFVDEYNTKMIDELAKLRRVYVIHSVGETREAAICGKRTSENIIHANVNNHG